MRFTSHLLEMAGCLVRFTSHLFKTACFVMCSTYHYLRLFIICSVVRSFGRDVYMFGAFYFPPIQGDGFILEMPIGIVRFTSHSLSS